MRMGWALLPQTNGTSEADVDLTRRAFLSSVSRSMAWAAASTAALGCAGASMSAKRQEPEPISPRAGRRVIRPPAGQVLFIAGQGSAQLGGQPVKGWSDGYLDHMLVPPGGFTMYCSVAGPPDLKDLSGTCDLRALKDSVLHLSVGWVPDFDLPAKENNRLITTGAFDANIDGLAHWCAAQPRPILMRIGYEFDRAVPIANYHYDPAYFAQAFRRIVDRLRAAGADNVASVLASTNVPPVLTTEAFNRFYAGDDYVDWLGCSMWSPATVDTVILSEARKRRKPVLLAETTPVKYDIGKGTGYPYFLGASQPLSAKAIWDGWHQPMIDFIGANRDVIAGWHYIAADWSTDPIWNWVPVFTHCDARPWASAAFLEIWNQHINATPFLQAAPGLFLELGY
jgi:hypothetical protein